MYSRVVEGQDRVEVMRMLDLVLVKKAVVKYMQVFMERKN